MNFLQPWMLAALPLVALPIIIHLINQRRFQTIPWGAMMFLLAAQKMSRGYSRIRQWLIMLFRMLAVAGLIFAVSRPLSSGWLGRAAGARSDTTLILLDRSASMQQHGRGTGVSKLDTGRRQLVQTLGVLQSSRWVLIESTQNKPREIESPETLLHLTNTTSTSSAADIPAMLEVARDYIQAHKSGQTEIWICSDLRDNDWNSESGRWQTLRDSLQALPQGIRIHLLAYAQPPEDNLALRVTDVKRQGGEHPELLVSLSVTRTGNSSAPVSIPLQFEIDGARSVVQAEINGPEFQLKDHRIPLQQQQEQGWGSVSIPADTNPADNTFYLAYGPPPERRTLIVAENDSAALPLQLAASIPPDSRIKTSTEVVSVTQLPTLEWETVGTVLWQAQLPEGELVPLLESFLNRGGQVIFFPPSSPSGAAFAGTRWGDWVESPNELKVENWRGDEDLLAHTLSGSPLPVGQLSIRRYAPLEAVSPQTDAPGKVAAITPLASLPGGIPLLSHLPSDRGGIYFCSTTPAMSDSSLSSNGIVLYVMIQRALSLGSDPLRTTRTLAAGPLPAENVAEWAKLAGPTDVDPAEFSFQSGIYSADDKTIVVNSPPAEDISATLDDKQLQSLFQGLDFSRVDDAAGNLQSLIQEIWRIFMGAMIVALVAEAALCLPSRERKSPTTNFAPGGTP